MALANLSIYYTWKNITSEYNNKKFKMSAHAWNDTFDLPGGLYSFSDIQDYSEFYFETLTENPPVQIYPNKTKKQNCFENKDRLFLKPSNPPSSNSESFKYKTSIIGNTYNVGLGEAGQDANKL